MTDFRGLTICKGDLVAYPVDGRSGVKLQQKLGTVDEVQDKRLKIIDRNGRVVTIHTIENVAVLGRN